MAGGELFGHDGVVARQLFERPLKMQEVGAGVADMGELDGSVLAKLSQREGRTHPCQAELVKCAFDDRLVRSDHALDRRPRTDGSMLDRELGGDLPTNGSSHPVGHHQHHRTGAGPGSFRSE